MKRFQCISESCFSFYVCWPLVSDVFYVSVYIYQGREDVKKCNESPETYAWIGQKSWEGCIVFTLSEWNDCCMCSSWLLFQALKACLAQRQEPPRAPTDLHNEHMFCAMEDEQLAGPGGALSVRKHTPANTHTYETHTHTDLCDTCP